MRRRLKLLIPTIVLALLPAPRPTLAANSIWVGTTADLAVFIQWTERQGKLSGQLQAAWLVPTSGYSRQWDVWTRTLKVESMTRPFVGVRSGSSVTLSHSAGNWTGTIAGRSLQLVIPQQGGSLWKLALTPGSVQRYNRAVTSLYGVAAAVNERNAIMAAVQARGRDLARTLDVLAGDIVEVRGSSDLSGVLARYPVILRRMEELEAEIHAKAAVSPLSCSELGSIQVRLGSVEVAMGSVEVANGSFDIARSRLRGAISKAERTIARVLAVLASLQRAVSADPTRTMTADQMARTERGIRATLNSATNELWSATMQLTEAERTMSDYNTRARQLLERATVLVKSLKCNN